MSNTPPLTPRPLSDLGERVLAEVEGKRGYLLPYHRMFAASAPELLRDYDRFYQSLTLDPRVLTPYQRETVWAGLLAAAREVHGFIHMRRAVAAGLSEHDRVRAVTIAAMSEGHEVLAFSAGNWAAWTDPDAVQTSYLSAFGAVAGDLEPALAHLTALVCHAARRHEPGVRLHLVEGFKHGLRTDQICEGLSYLLLPCGGNTLIEAVSYWENAARDGLCPAPY